MNFFKYRINDTTNTLLKMPKMVDGYFEKIAKQRRQGETKAKKREQLAEKAREMFGYDLDPRDPRFVEILSEEKRVAAKSKKNQAKPAAAAATTTTTTTAKK